MASRNRKKEPNRLEVAAEFGPSSNQIKALRELKEYAGNGFVGGPKDLSNLAKQLGYDLKRGKKHLTVVTPDGRYVMDVGDNMPITIPYGKRSLSGPLFKQISLGISVDFERRTNYPLNQV